MVRRSRTRAGVTLLEVLVAIFVMAIGMLAILTLFPLGAINMAQAIKDDRTRQTADQADAFMRMYWLNSVATLPGTPNRDDMLANSLANPNLVPPDPFPSVPLANNQLKYGTTPEVFPPVAIASQPSYPVLIDPLAFFAEAPGGQPRFWVARGSTNAGLLIPRRNLNIAIPPNIPPSTPAIISQLAVQTCCMVDDMTFHENGSPDPGLLRQGRYSWAVMLRRPQSSQPNTATMTILVFEGRPPLLATPGDEVMLQGLANVTVTGTRTINLMVPTRTTEQTPLIRKGGWILDGTIDPAAGIRNANFYRIAGVTEGTPDPATGRTPFALDLQTDLKPTSGTPQIYLFAGLSEVFERPPLTAATQ